ncbi:unnamed protein product [Cylicocyclus nassatus]|uniref:Uncharacterized protein n=1 Tax=Cylicocyclus nassatus TaxID=53992 RepID=A0AA36HAT9_CYLNA|nr:unnamed protein product [Cylicocyclus nassatus]
MRSYLKPNYYLSHNLTFFIIVHKLPSPDISCPAWSNFLFRLYICDNWKAATKCHLLHFCDLFSRFVAFEELLQIWIPLDPKNNRVLSSSTYLLKPSKKNTEANQSESFAYKTVDLSTAGKYHTITTAMAMTSKKEGVLGANFRPKCNIRIDSRSSSFYKYKLLSLFNFFLRFFICY